MGFLDSIWGGITDIFTPAPGGATGSGGFEIPWGDLITAGASALGGYAQTQSKIDADRELIPINQENALAQIAAQNQGRMDLAAFQAANDQSKAIAAMQVAAQKEIEAKRRLAEAYRLAVENAQASGVNQSGAFRNMTNVYKGFGR